MNTQPTEMLGQKRKKKKTRDKRVVQVPAHRGSHQTFSQLQKHGSGFGPEEQPVITAELESPQHSQEIRIFIFFSFPFSFSSLRNEGQAEDRDFIFALNRISAVSRAALRNTPN